MTNIDKIKDEDLKAIREIINEFSRKIENIVNRGIKHE